MFNDETLDFTSKKNTFMLCNEFAARYTVSNELEKASIMLDKGQNILNHLFTQYDGHNNLTLQ